jgi:hypothetical protein
VSDLVFLEQFESAVREIIASSGEPICKTIGDLNGQLH